MISKVVALFVLLSIAMLGTAEAFWWAPTATTTTTEAPTVLKQIPLTYFRTYTYQPLTANPFVFPFFGQGGYAPPAPQQAPLLTGPRYNQHFTNNGYNPAEQHRMLKDAPIATSTVPPTTTTTTTTPAPTTTPSTTTTTTTTTTTPPPPPPPPTQSPMLDSGAVPFYGSEYPTFNRRIYTNGYSPSSNYFRPHYPYPNYAPYSGPAVAAAAAAAAATPTTSNFDGSRRSNIQFVPCMCPVSVAAGVGGLAAAGMPNPADQFNSGYMIQSRSSSDDNNDDEADADLPRDSDDGAASKHLVVIEPDLEASLAKGLAGVAAAAAVPTNADASQLTNKIDADLHEQTDDDRLTLSEQV